MQALMRSLMNGVTAGLLAWGLLACSGESPPGPDLSDARAADAGGDTRWQRLPDIGLGPVQESGAVVLDGSIYLVGGFDEALGMLASAQRYDIALGTWSEVAPLPRRVHHPNLASAGGKLYVLGALMDTQFNQLALCWEYDPMTDTWSSIESMGAHARGAAAVATLDGRIYVAGGLRNGQAVTDFSVYDPATGSWNHQLAPMPTGRDHLVAAAVDGRFYAISGRSVALGNLIGRVDAYDPVTDTWTRRADIPTERGGMAAGVVDGRILVVGGEGAANQSGVFPEVESYDPATDTWTSLGEMRTPRHGMGAVGYQGTLYVPGGATRQAFAAVATFEAFTP